VDDGLLQGGKSVESVDKGNTYRLPQEESPIYCEVRVSVILNKIVYVRVLFRTVSEIELFRCTVHCTDEQHTMSTHELQSALMLTVEFSKMYYTR
jgi:hypothetical protein